MNVPATRAAVVPVLSMRGIRKEGTVLRKERVVAAGQGERTEAASSARVA